MTHTHSPQSTREILGNELYECSCGAKKWSNDRVFNSESGTFRVEDGWYVYIPNETKEEKARRKFVENLQTEGYGYDYNQPEAQDQYDGGRGAGSLGQPID